MLRKERLGFFPSVLSGRLVIAAGTVIAEKAVPGVGIDFIRKVLLGVRERLDNLLHVLLWDERIFFPKKKIQRTGDFRRPR